MCHLMHLTPTRMKQAKIVAIEEDIGKKIVAIEEDIGEPDHWPGLLLRVKGPRGWIIGVWVACLLIQIFQLYIINLLREDAAQVPLSRVEGWISDGFLDYTQAYNDTFKENRAVDMLDAYDTGALVLTQKGSNTRWRNIFMGIGLLMTRHYYELNAIFCSNDYELKDQDFLRREMSWHALLGQIVVGAYVVFACAQSVFVNALDTAGTLEKSLYAFFILEIDDQLVPLAWTLVRCFKQGN